MARLQLELEPDEPQRLGQVALPFCVGRVTRDGPLAELTGTHTRSDVLTPGLAARGAPVGRKALSCEVLRSRGAESAEVRRCGGAEVCGGVPSPADVKAAIASSKRCMLYMA